MRNATGLALALLGLWSMPVWAQGQFFNSNLTVAGTINAGTATGSGGSRGGSRGCLDPGRGELLRAFGGLGFPWCMKDVWISMAFHPRRLSNISMS